MDTSQTLYDKALKITQSNAALYDRWESAIAAHLSKKWKDAFELAAEVAGTDEPTIMEVADMGASAISDETEFLSDINEVFRTLAKGCSLDINGDWN